MVVDTVLTILSSAWLGPLAKKIASFGGTKRKGKAQELAKIGDVFSGGRVDKRSASTTTILGIKRRSKVDALRLSTLQ